MWLLVAGCVAGSCLVDAGSLVAAVLALTWPAWGLAVVALELGRAGAPSTWSQSTAVRMLIGGYSLVAASWFALSRMAVAPLGIHEPIVELTAVHFTYVGVGALVLARAAADQASGSSGRWLSRAALGLTAGAPPVVAVGFVTGVGVAQVGGAVLMSLGVFATATLQLIEARRATMQPATRALLGLSGLAVWAPMVLAVAWAAGQHWDVPALSIPDMVRTHGTLNALGFIGAGLLGRHLSAIDPDRRRQGTLAVHEPVRVASRDSRGRLGHEDGASPVLLEETT